jgi:hypothetical protein
MKRKLEILSSSLDSQGGSLVDNKSTEEFSWNLRCHLGEEAAHQDDIRDPIIQEMQSLPMM